MDFTPLESLVQERPEPVLALRKDKFHWGSSRSLTTCHGRSHWRHHNIQRSRCHKPPVSHWWSPQARCSSLPCIFRRHSSSANTNGRSRGSDPTGDPWHRSSAQSPHWHWQRWNECSGPYSQTAWGCLKIVGKPWITDNSQIWCFVSLFPFKIYIQVDIRLKSSIFSHPRLAIKAPAVWMAFPTAAPHFNQQLPMALPPPTACNNRSPWRWPWLSSCGSSSSAARMAAEARPSSTAPMARKRQGVSGGAADSRSLSSKEADSAMAAMVKGLEPWKSRRFGDETTKTWTKCRKQNTTKTWTKCWTEKKHLQKNTKNNQVLVGLLRQPSAPRICFPFVSRSLLRFPALGSGTYCCRRDSDFGWRDAEASSSIQLAG